MKLERPPGPSDRVEQGGSPWRVHRALGSLPEREREVLALRVLERPLPVARVAEFLSHPRLGTVKTRTRAALAKLSDLLEDDLQ